MPELAAQLEIPNRALFKAAEVCDLVKVQPYVLRSWEAEFPELGVTKSAGAARVYRRTDVEQVVRIKHLLLVEGLTLAGARRRLDEEGAPVVPESVAIEALVGQNARERLTAVKRGLQSILELLTGAGHVGEFRLAAPVAKSAPATRARAMQAERVKPARGKTPASRHAAARSPQARRNRSA
jgi:DNA-binding transcriptional MerR regulator